MHDINKGNKPGSDLTFIVQILQTHTSRIATAEHGVLKVKGFRHTEDTPSKVFIESGSSSTAC